LDDTSSNESDITEEIGHTENKAERQNNKSTEQEHDEDKEE
jgi:hypothetical protein